MRLFRYAYLFLAALSLCHAAVEAAESDEPIVVRLTTENKLLPLYLAPIDASQPGVDVDPLARILAFDLNYNGMTHVVNRTEAGDKLLKKSGFEGTDDLNAWKQLNVYYVIKVRITGKKLSAKVVSVNNRYTHVIDDIALTGDIGNDRRQIHRLADAIHKALFNTNGVASTRFLYTIKKKAAGNDPEKVVTEIWEADYDGGNARRVLSEPALAINPTYFPPSVPRSWINKSGRLELSLMKAT